MRKKFNILLILIMFCSAISLLSSQINADDNNAILKQNDILFEYEITIKDGMLKIVLGIDDFTAEGLVKNSLKEGEWKIFYNYSKKIIYSKGIYKTNLKQGQWIEYFEDGNNIRKKENYKNGFLEGPQYEYSTEGVPLAELWYKNNLLDGVYRKYYPNGNPMEILMYSKNKKNGTENLYFANGKRNSVGQYKDGLKDGLWKYFYETGNIKSEGSYNKDVKTGKWKTYDENEKIINVESFN